MQKWVEDDYLDDMPAQPQERLFLDELEAPLHGEPIKWERSRPTENELSLVDGIRMDFRFADPERRLQSARRDFMLFLKSSGISTKGSCVLRVLHRPTRVFETYTIEVASNGVTVRAGDTEGVRRALIYLENEMLRAGGPFLARGSVTHVPVIRSRINLHILMTASGKSAFFPDAYLNRLAHNGVNGLMLPLTNIYPGRLVPEFEHDPEPMFKRLRQYVARYARHGIRLYPYVLEPRAFPAGHPLRRKYPDLLGGEGHGLNYYCPSSTRGLAFITRSFQKLFAGAPGLGGVIMICVGERPTHCCCRPVEGMRASNCPRCSRRRPRDVLRDVLGAVERGVHAASPSAECIAWPYAQYLSWGELLTRDAAAHMPRNVVLMHNYESAYRARQLGVTRRADDYWLSFPGPSQLFRDCARAARRKGTHVFAKTMVGCSHELSSVPYIPVPGILYDRFRNMHMLGVSGALQNWDSGNDPSLMNQLAGQLAFAPLPSSENDCLTALARRDWGRHAPKVVKAWRCFREAYANYPMTIGFSYFGPMHNGPVWPLYLEPRNLELGRNWLSDPPGGDRIGDCIGYHKLGEVIRLCVNMRDIWSRGVKLMAGLDRFAADSRERRQQLVVARVLGLHFRSGVNILKFYALREKLAWSARNRWADLLDKMTARVRDELEVDRLLLPLCEAYPRLGYCPEARAYKYFPAMIRWRMRTLRKLLATEFPRVRKRLAAGRPAFPHYTGGGLRGFVYKCARLSKAPPHNGMPTGGAWDCLAEHQLIQVKADASGNRLTKWKAAYDGRALYLAFYCREPRMGTLRARTQDPADLGGDDQIHIFFDVSQFEPQHRLLMNAAGAREYFGYRGMNVINPRAGSAPLLDLGKPKYYRWTVKARRGPDHWSLTVRVPLRFLNIRQPRQRPIRFHILRHADLLENPEVQTLTELGPDADRTDDPLHFGWMVFE